MLGEAAAKVLRDTNAIEVKRNSVIHARGIFLNFFMSCDFFERSFFDH
jgi:hypothetical protein